MTDKLVTIATFRFREEAYLSRGKLQSEGIVSFVTGDHIDAARYPYNLIKSLDVPIELHVRESEAEAAIRILKESNTAGVTYVAEGNIAKENVKKCPACQSTDIGDNRTLVQKIFNFFLLGILYQPYPRKNLKFKCKKCGYEWKEGER
ncbi:MAG: hypothetical protein JW856_05440 [Dehalococcoidales bacterium]|nr:hypothetical protein [Dehalococcoidales bacterium]